jgi:hypothetical protein
MRDVEISVNRGSTTKINVVHETLLEAVHLFVQTYGTMGIDKIDDKGESLKNNWFIEYNPALGWEV